MFRVGVCGGFIGATSGECGGGLCRCFSLETEEGRRAIVGEGRPAVYVLVRAAWFLWVVCWRLCWGWWRRPLLRRGGGRQGTSGPRRWVWIPWRRAVRMSL